VGVQHALRIAGGPGRVAERRGRPLVLDLVVDVALVGPIDHVLPEHDARIVGQFGRRAIVHHDDVLDRRDRGQVLAEQRQQRAIHEDRLVLGVVDRVPDLIREVPDVDRMQHPAGRGHGEVQREVPGGVPCEGPHPGVGRQAEGLHRPGQPPGVCGQAGEGGPLDAGHGAGDNRLAGVVLLPPAKDRVDGQGRVLHESQHLPIVTYVAVARKVHPAYRS
jgi:hypothetical protein